MNATTSDLRLKTGEILKAVDRGETVHVLRNGKECAVVAPPPKRAKRKRSMAEHPACGMWADRKDMEDVHAWLDKIRKPHFLEGERARPVTARKKARNRLRMEDHPFVGMWADDKEKEDVAAYVRKLRQDRYRDI